AFEESYVFSGILDVERGRNRGAELGPQGDGTALSCPDDRQMVHRVGRGRTGRAVEPEAPEAPVLRPGLPPLRARGGPVQRPDPGLVARSGRAAGIPPVQELR